MPNLMKKLRMNSSLCSDVVIFSDSAISECSSSMCHVLRVNKLDNRQLTQNMHSLLCLLYKSVIVSEIIIFASCSAFCIDIVSGV